MLQRARDNAKIAWELNQTVEELLTHTQGKREELSGLALKSLQTGKVKNFSCTGLFMAIGHQPTTELFREKLEMDEVGYIRTKPNSSYTNVPGVFACGDVQDRVYRQAVTAAGSGCMAAIDAERFLENAGH